MVEAWPRHCTPDQAVMTYSERGQQVPNKNSKRRQAIEMPLHDKAVFEAIFNAIPDAVVSTDTDRRIIMANPAALTLFGYDESTLYGQTTEMLYADSKDFHAQGRHRFRIDAPSDTAPYEMNYRRKDGSTFPGETLGTQVKDNNGNVIGYIGLFRNIAARKQSEQALRDSEARNRMVIESALDAIIVIDDNSVIKEWNPRAETTFGWKASEIVGQTLMETIIPSQHREAHKQGLENLLKTGKGPILNQHNELTALHQKGHEFPIELTIAPLRHGGSWTFSAFIRDLSERKQSKEALGQSEASFKALAEESPNMIYINTRGRVVFANKACEEQIGYKRQEIYADDFDFMCTVAPESRDLIRQKFLQHQKGEEIAPYEYKVLTRDQKVLTVIHASRLIEFNGEKSILGIITDITERTRIEQQLQYMAHHDALTELPNRVLFMDRLSQSLAHADRHNRLVAVLFMDLDRFKLINDTMGHDFGDRALQALAGRLNECVRAGDTVARLGGDEFAVVLEDIASADDVVHIARKILSVLSQSFLLDEREFFITTSIGISLFPMDGKDTQTLLKHADIAMYRSKDQGRNTYQFYSSDMSAKTFERLSMETNLRHALEREEFVLYYQPQLDLLSRRVIGVEALLRWQHPDLGLIMPNEFISILEDTGLIVPVGEWVLRNACLQARAWNDGELKPLRMAVNLSSRQFNEPKFVGMLERILEDTGLKSSLLELEITESILMQDVGTTVSTLNAIHDMGVRLAVDDFGTGYSSLSYLKRFPIDTLKIDQSFIHDIDQDPDDATLVEAIIALGRALRLNIIAEGVESEVQADFLKIHNCDCIQGYLFNSPQAAQDLEKRLREK